MAGIILGGVAGSISDQLDSLISKRTGPVRAHDVRAKLEELQRTLLPITKLLREIEERGDELDPEVIQWSEQQQLRDVIYDADDLVDDYLTEALHQSRIQGSRFMKEVHIFFSSSNYLLYNFRMASRVKEVRRKLRIIQHHGSNLHLLTSHGEKVRQSMVPSSDEHVIIGRNMEKLAILESLLSPNFEADVTVLPIVGVLGVGKTAFAKLLFTDELVMEYFNTRLWVCVTTDYILDSLVIEMLGQCTSERGRTYPDMDEAWKCLGENLHGKRVLLVLDDVWEKDRGKWLELQHLLDGAAKGSKILVTTRELHVAEAATAPLIYGLNFTPFPKKIYRLNDLTGYESLCLLMREAGKAEDDNEYEALIAIGKEIVLKCAGLPLLIKCVARKLRSSENALEDWSSFMDLDSSKLAEDADIMSILRLRYSDLPSNLKQCVAYCSLFPRNYKFDSLGLINLWISQGYINSLDNGKTPEDVGYDHLMELVSRCFFTVTEEDNLGNPRGCRMNHFMHALAKHVAGNQCFVLDCSNDGDIPETSLHLSTYLKDFDLKRVRRMNKLRTFLLLDEHPRGDEYCSVDWAKFMSHFDKLRALRLPGVPNLRNILNSIARLRHLRYLNLSNNIDLEVLPTSISNLHNLETLNLEGCCRLIELPHGISKLASMRHLHMRGCDKLSHIPKGVEKLTRLQTLCQFVVGNKVYSNKATLSDLSRLDGLRHLAIRHLEREALPESVASHLRNSSHLQSLELDWEDTSDDIIRDIHERVLESLQPHKILKQFIIRGYGGDRFGAWGSQLENLVQLEIHDCLHCKHIPSLDHLPNLRSISLLNMWDLEHIELSGTGENASFFPSLRRLDLKNLPEFKGWERRSNKDEVDTHEEWDLKILSIPDRYKFQVHGCPRLSFLKGRFLSLWGVTGKILKKLVRSYSEGDHRIEWIQSRQMAITSILSVSLNKLESIEISNLLNVESLPEELFKSLPALRSLAIKRCVHLKALNGWTMLRYLSALTRLEISMCPKLDLSAENDDEDRHYLQQQEGQRKLSHLSIHSIPKMENLPGWIQCLPNIEYLSIRHCNALEALSQFVDSLTSLRTLQIDFCEGFKSLQGRVILQLSFTSLESLKIKGCPQLDFSGKEDCEFSGPGKLQELVIHGCEKIRTLPWWIQHLTNLEALEICYCPSLEALPEWFPQLTSLKKLSLRSCGQLSERCKRELERIGLRHLAFSI